MGGRQGDVSGGCGRGAGVSAAGQEGTWERRCFRRLRRALIDGDIAFRQHTGGHTPAPNWPTFLAFAGRYLHAPEQRKGSAHPAEELAEREAAIKDHQRMMDLLGIKELRPPCEPRSEVANAVNYDESKANPYPTLPDPLKLKDGKRVTSAEMWWTKRRPEIVEDFDREILGRVPAQPAQGDVGGGEHEARRRLAGVPVVTKTAGGPRGQLSRIPRSR